MAEQGPSEFLMSVAAQKGWRQKDCHQLWSHGANDVGGMRHHRNIVTRRSLSNVKANEAFSVQRILMNDFIKVCVAEVAMERRRRQEKGGFVPRLPSLLMIIVLFVLAQADIIGASAQTKDAQTKDPHILYEQRCGGCHAEHAGDFVGDSLLNSNGDIYGRKSGQELRSFLESGHGKLTVFEIETMVRHLTNIQNSGQLFRNKCRICHDRAVILARRKLIVKDGELIGRNTKRNIAQFLSGHGRLTSDEVSTMVDVLKRQLDTQERRF